MNKYIKYFLVVVFFFLLVLVRSFAAELFHDPFMQYFKNDYLYKVIPYYNNIELFKNLFFRYALNSIISIGIIYLLFQKQFLVFSLKFYIIAFLILSTLLFIVLHFEFFKSYLPLFYLRRFLIHPIFVLLLIPAFYYQKKNA